MKDDKHAFEIFQHLQEINYFLLLRAPQSKAYIILNFYF